MKKDGVVLYISHYQAIKTLSDEQLGKLYRAIFEKQLGNEVVLSADIQIAFNFINNQMVVDTTKYNQMCENNRKNGAKGGAPKGNQNAKKTTKTTETTECEKNNPKEKEKEKEKDKEKDNDKDIIITTTTSNNNKSCFVVVEEEFGRTLSSTEIEKIIELEDEYGTDKLKLAVKECCLNNVKKIAYLNGILKNWKDKTLDEIKNEKLSETQPKLSVSQQEIEISEYDWVNADEE